MSLFPDFRLDPNGFTPLDYSAERALQDQGVSIVAGTDEVGRGCLAGPVMAAAVVLDPENIPQGLRDSKKLSPKARDRLAIEIKSSALAWGLGAGSVGLIDSVNILNASLTAMHRAVNALSLKPDHVLVDGNRPPRWGYPSTLVTKGDDRVLSIAAASILAKVSRDRVMAALGDRYPDYGWAQNAGYGAPVHLNALKLVGVTDHHRKSFKPIREAIS